MLAGEFAAFLKKPWHQGYNLGYEYLRPEIIQSITIRTCPLLAYKETDWFQLKHTTNN